MSIVRRKGKRIGVTYVYGQEKGVWDPQKKQMRSKRTLIGKSLYEEQKKRNIELNQKIAAKDIEIAQLRQELHNMTGQ